MDAIRTDDEVTVYIDAPGFGSDDIDLNVEKNSVIVEASRRWYDADADTLFSERPQGSFRRQIQFGDSVDVDQISAKLEHGVLHLTLPVKESTKPRKVDIEFVAHDRELTPAD